MGRNSGSNRAATRTATQQNQTNSVSNATKTKEEFVTRQYYNQMSETGAGRKELHDIMLDAVKIRMNRLVNSAPQGNQNQIKSVFDSAYNKMQSLGNGDIMDFFAEKGISDQNFARYMYLLYQNKLK